MEVSHGAHGREEHSSINNTHHGVVLSSAHFQRCFTHSFVLVCVPCAYTSFSYFLHMKKLRLCLASAMKYECIFRAKRRETKGNEQNTLRESEMLKGKRMKGMKVRSLISRFHVRVIIIGTYSAGQKLTDTSLTLLHVPDSDMVTFCNHVE